MRGQGRYALPHLLERQRVQPRELQAPGQGTQLLLELGVPELLERGVAEHDGEGRRVGQQPQDVPDDGRGVEVEVDDDLVRLLRELRPVAGVEAGDEQRDRRRELFAVRGREVRGGAADRDHEVGLPAGHERSDVPRERALPADVLEARQLERRFQELDRPRRLAGDLVAQDRGELGERGEAAPEGVDDEDAARRRLRRAGARA